MTPDELHADMEGRIDGFVQRWEARMGTGAQTGDAIYCVTVTGFDGEAELRASDLRALLKAYQEQRRALEAASPVVPVGVSRETLLKAVRPVLDRHPMIDSSQSHKLDIQAGWVADALLAALRPTDTGANHD